MPLSKRAVVLAALAILGSAAALRNDNTVLLEAKGYDFDNSASDMMDEVRFAASQVDPLVAKALPPIVAPTTSVSALAGIAATDAIIGAKEAEWQIKQNAQVVAAQTKLEETRAKLETARVKLSLDQNVFSTAAATLESSKNNVKQSKLNAESLAKVVTGATDALAVVSKKDVAQKKKQTELRAKLDKVKLEAATAAKALKQKETDFIKVKEAARKAELDLEKTRQNRAAEADREARAIEADVVQLALRKEQEGLERINRLRLETQRNSAELTNRETAQWERENKYLTDRSNNLERDLANLKKWMDDSLRRDQTSRDATVAREQTQQKVNLAKIDANRIAIRSIDQDIMAQLSKQEQLRERPGQIDNAQIEAAGVARKLKAKKQDEARDKEFIEAQRLKAAEEARLAAIEAAKVAEEQRKKAEAERLKAEAERDKKLEEERIARAASLAAPSQNLATNVDTKSFSGIKSLFRFQQEGQDENNDFASQFEAPIMNDSEDPLLQNLTEEEKAVLIELDIGLGSSIGNIGNNIGGNIGGNGGIDTQAFLLSAMKDLNDRSDDVDLSTIGIVGVIGPGNGITPQDAVDPAFFLTKKNEITAGLGKIKSRVERLRTAGRKKVTEISGFERSITDGKQAIFRANNDFDVKRRGIIKDYMTRRDGYMRDFQAERDRLHREYLEKMKQTKSEFTPRINKLFAEMANVRQVVKVEVEKIRSTLPGRLKDSEARFKKLAISDVLPLAAAKGKIAPAETTAKTAQSENDKAIKKVLTVQDALKLATLEDMSGQVTLRRGELDAAKVQVTSAGVAEKKADKDLEDAMAVLAKTKALVSADESAVKTAEAEARRLEEEVKLVRDQRMPDFSVEASEQSKAATSLAGSLATAASVTPTSLRV